jgi:hypothetical protein
MFELVLKFSDQMTKRQKKQKTGSESDAVVPARIHNEPEPTGSLVIPVYYRIYGLENAHRTLRAVLRIDKLKVEASMDMFDFLDAVEQRVQTVSRFIRAGTMTIHRLRQGGDVSNTPADVLTIDSIESNVDMDSSVLDSRTSMNDPLILVFPTEPVLTNPLTWVKAAEETTKALLTNDELAFVNRTDVMAELLDIHQVNFNRLFGRGGLSQVIPVLDNLRGMGKTSLVAKYISECPKYFDSCLLSREFRESIKNARTITLKFENGKLFGAMNENELTCERVIANELISWIESSQEITGSTERMEARSKEEYQPSTQAIMTFIKETGRPLFLVIDDIGVAFSAKTQLGPAPHRARVEWDVFLKFFKQVVMAWLEIPNLHILLTGRVDFLDWIRNMHPMFEFREGGSGYLQRIGL